MEFVKVKPDYSYCFRYHVRLKEFKYFCEIGTSEQIPGRNP